MKSMSVRFVLAAAALAATLTSPVHAQVPQYGPNVGLEQARKVVAGALAEARKISVPMAVAIVDNAGQLVLFERMDNTQTGSVLVAQIIGQALQVPVSKPAASSD